MIPSNNDELDDCNDSVRREGWSCWLGNTKVTSDPVNAIIQYVYYQLMQDHCEKSENLALEAFDTIDWEAIEHPTSSSPELFNLWMSKQVSGFCPASKNMERWGFWEDSKCHSCHELSEDTNHLCFCPHEDQRDAWEEAVDGLEAWMIGANLRSSAASLRHCK